MRAQTDLFCFQVTIQRSANVADQTAQPNFSFSGNLFGDCGTSRRPSTLPLATSSTASQSSSSRTPAIELTEREHRVEFQLKIPPTQTKSTNRYLVPPTLECSERILGRKRLTVQVHKITFLQGLNDDMPRVLMRPLAIKINREGLQCSNASCQRCNASFRQAAAREWRFSMAGGSWHRRRQERHFQRVTGDRRRIAADEGSAKAATHPETARYF